MTQIFIALSSLIETFIYAVCYFHGCHRDVFRIKRIRLIAILTVQAVIHLESILEICMQFNGFRDDRSYSSPVIYFWIGEILVWSIWKIYGWLLFDTSRMPEGLTLEVTLKTTTAVVSLILLFGHLTLTSFMNSSFQIIAKFKNAIWPSIKHPNFH